MGVMYRAVWLNQAMREKERYLRYAEKSMWKTMIARAKKNPHDVRKRKYTFGNKQRDRYGRLWQDCQEGRQSHKKSKTRKGPASYRMTMKLKL